MKRNNSILFAVFTAQAFGFDSEEFCSGINGGGTG